MFSFQIVIGSRRELVANSIHTADATPTQLNSTVESRRRCVLGIILTLHCVFLIESLGGSWLVYYYYFGVLVCHQILISAWKWFNLTACVLCCVASVLHFPVLHFHVVHFHACIFTSCIFMACNLVLHFHVLHFHATPFIVKSLTTSVQVSAAI